MRREEIMFNQSLRNIAIRIVVLLRFKLFLPDADPGLDSRNFEIREAFHSKSKSGPISTIARECQILDRLTTCLARLSRERRDRRARVEGRLLQLAQVIYLSDSYAFV